MENTAPQPKNAFATEPIGRLIVKFAVPSVIALLVNSLYNIVDQIFIGNGVAYLLQNWKHRRLSRLRYDPPKKTASRSARPAS